MEDAIKNIVFLFPHSVINSEKYGIPRLRDKGFDTLAFDVSALLRNRAFRLYRNIRQGKRNRVDAIASYEEFEERVSELSGHSVFIDYLVGLSHFTLENEKIFRILEKYNAIYYVISGGALPPAFSGACKKRRFVRFGSVLGKLTDPRKVVSFISREIIQFMRNHSGIYPLPKKIFSGESELLLDYIRRHKKVADRVVPVHSLDYDVYLDFVAKLETTNTVDGDYVLFLDEGATDHPDFDVLRMKGLEKDLYFSTLRTFFDRVERDIGLKVIVAAHPFSDYTTRKDAFGDRQIIGGQTVALVSRASLVIMHSTTAINFAILYNKPILFVKTQDMIEKGRSGIIDSMANSVGATAINISDNDVSFREHIAYPGEYYERYLYKYIKSRSVGDKSIWEIVAEEAGNERISHSH